jgi:hypothetical protein
MKTVKLAAFAWLLFVPPTSIKGPGLLFFNGLCMETGNDLNMLCGREYWDKLIENKL